MKTRRPHAERAGAPSFGYFSRDWQTRSRSVAIWLPRAIVAGCFLYAGALKAWHPGQLQSDIERYQLVPVWFAWGAAAFLPYLEIGSALALLFPAMAWAGRILIGALLIIFVAALASAWARGLNVACGCFGAALSEKPNYPWWIGRDLLLLGLLGQRNLKSGPASQSCLVEEGPSDMARMDPEKIEPQQ